jgi:site-specific recombinase XerD
MCFQVGDYQLIRRTNKIRRHHIHENGIQKAIKKASAEAEITKKANCHCLRHYVESDIMGRMAA